MAAITIGTRMNRHLNRAGYWDMSDSDGVVSNSSISDFPHPGPEIDIEDLQDETTEYPDHTFIPGIGHVQNMIIEGLNDVSRQRPNILRKTWYEADFEYAEIYGVRD